MNYTRRPKTPPTPPRAKGPIRHALPSPDAAFDPEALTGTILPDTTIHGDIPPHVWAMLQQAGETAAARLVQILQSPRFDTYAPSAQRGLIELALTRAYGLPIKRALQVNLNTSDRDAVAASLAALADKLPETARTVAGTVLPDLKTGAGS